jgi:acetyl esterase/lipase
MNVQYTQSGPPESMDIYSRVGATAAQPAIVMIHGGGWAKGGRQDLAFGAAYFVKERYVYCTIDYRLDDVDLYPAQIEDCKCAIRFLRANAAAYHIDPARVAVWGESAGGHLAALLGTTAGVKRLEGDGGWQDQSSAVQAVVDWYGPTDLRPQIEQTYANQQGISLVKHLLGGDPKDKPDLAGDASPVTFVAAGDPPFLIMHGGNDTLVPPSQSQELYDALKAAGDSATLKIVQGAGHGGNQFLLPDNFLIVDDFLRGILKPGSQPANAR